MQYINLLLEYLYQSNLYLKLEKCKFYKEEVNFLGFLIRRNKIYINLDKI